MADEKMGGSSSQERKAFAKRRPLRSGLVTRLEWWNFLQVGLLLLDSSTTLEAGSTCLLLNIPG